MDSSIQFLSFGAVAALMTTIAACREPDIPFGFDGVSSDSRWASALETSIESGSETAELVIFDLASEQPRIARRLSTTWILHSRFSEDGRHLFLQSGRGLSIVDLASVGERSVLIAPPSSQPQVGDLLANDSLIVLDCCGERVVDKPYRLRVSNLATPRQIDLQFDGISHAIIDKWGYMTKSSAVSTCSTATHGRWAAVLLHESGGVTNLVATSAREPIQVERYAGGVALLRLIEGNLAAIREGVGTISTRSPTAMSGEEIESAVQDYSSTFMARSIAVSPDARRVLLLQIEPQLPIASDVNTIADELSPLYTLYLVDVFDRAEPWVLSLRTTWKPGFSFSPDGSQIMFESNVDAGRSLFIADSSGTGRRKIAGAGSMSRCWH